MKSFLSQYDLSLYPQKARYDVIPSEPFLLYMLEESLWANNIGSQSSPKGSHGWGVVLTVT